MTSRRIPQLDALSGAAVASDDAFVVFDTSADATKRLSRPDMAAALVPNLAGAGLSPDGFGALRLLPDPATPSAVQVTGSGLAVGLGNINGPFTGLRSRNQSTGVLATAAAEVSTGLADVTAALLVDNNNGAPVARVQVGAGVTTLQVRAGTHVWTNQAGTVEYGRLTSSGLLIPAAVESSVGFRFPNGSLQTVAAVSPSAATETAAGIVELATGAEVNTGTDAVRAVTPATLATVSPATVPLAATDRFLILDASDGFRLKQAALTTRLLQQVSAQSTTRVVGTTLTPLDNTIPQSSEGTEFLVGTITPQAATSILMIEVTVQLFSSNSAAITMHLHREVLGILAPDAVAASVRSMSAASMYELCTLRCRVVAGTSDPITFRLRAGPAVASTLVMNGDGASGVFNGAAVSLMTITEIAA